MVFVDEVAEQWALVNTPLGEAWSGRTRYAAAMYFHKRGELSADALEVYRICSRLDGENPAVDHRRARCGRRLARALRGPESTLIRRPSTSCHSLCRRNSAAT